MLNWNIEIKIIKINEHLKIKINKTHKQDNNIAQYSLPVSYLCVWKRNLLWLCEIFSVNKNLPFMYDKLLEESP
jgi:hypothetical protein